MKINRTRMKLVIDVEYETGKTMLQELERVLVDAAEHLADNGLLSGDTEADAVAWNATVHRVDEADEGIMKQEETT